MTRARDHRLPGETHAGGVSRYRAAMQAVTGARDVVIAKLVDAYPHGRNLRTAPVAELQHLGLTAAQVRRIRATLELQEVLDQLAARELNGRVVSPSDAAVVGRAACREAGGLEQEAFVVIGLDARRRVQLVKVVALGSVAQVDVHPREVFRPMIRAGAHSLIIGHCHPSGDAEPSEADVELTRRLVEVGRLVGIPVLDHVIVTDTEHLSMAQVGLLPGS